MAHGPDASRYMVTASVVLVPPRVAAWLDRHVPALERARVEQRGRDDEVSSVLLALRVAALRWREQAGSERGTPAAPTPEPGAAWLTTRQAGDVLGLTDRAVRRRIESGRLPAQRQGDRWLISRADVDLDQSPQ